MDTNEKSLPLAYCPPSYKKTERLTFECGRKDLIFSALFCLLSILCTDSAFWGGFQAGYAFFTSVIFIFSLCYIRSKRVSFFSVFCTASVFAALPVFGLYADIFSKFWLFWAVNVFIVTALTQLCGVSLYKPGGYRFVSDIFHTAFCRSFGSIGTTVRSLVSSGLSSKKKQHVSVLIGILCAIPALAIILPLLISSDAAFEGLIEHLELDPFRIFTCVILGLGLFIFIFSLLFSLEKKPPNDRTRKKRSEGKLASAPITAFLSVIALVYIIYLFSQLAYFIGGLSGILPDDFTVSEYARRGFFEMCVLCTINMAIGFVSVLIVHKKDGKIPSGTKTLFLFFCVFSLLLIGSSIGKMILYIEAFGMTRMRICTSVFMVMMAFVFIFAILRIFISSFPYFKAAFIAVTVLGLVTAWGNIDAVVAQYNTNAYISGKLSTVDVYTITELSDSAVSSLIILARDNDPDIAEPVRDDLAYRFSRYYDVNSKDMQTPRASSSLSSYNLTRENAKRLLLENKALFEDHLDNYRD